MMEKNNWLYFLIFAGIIIPAIFFFLTGYPFEYGYFRNKIVFGHPYLHGVFNFLVIAVIILPFKIIQKLKIQANRIPGIYILSGVIVTLFFLQGLLPSSLSYIPQNQPQRYYTDIVNFEDKRGFFAKHAGALTHLIILGIFLFSFITNFPAREKNKINQG